MPLPNHSDRHEADGSGHPPPSASWLLKNHQPTGASSIHLSDRLLFWSLYISIRISKHHVHIQVCLLIQKVDCSCQVLCLLPTPTGPLYWLISLSCLLLSLSLLLSNHSFLSLHGHPLVSYIPWYLQGKHRR